MIHFTFTAKSKLCLSFMLFLLTLPSAHLDTPTYFALRNPDYAIGSCSGSDIKNGSALEANLKEVLNSLVENVNKTGFNISCAGENREKMYGLAQCRGDLNASACRACVSNAPKDLGETCQNISATITYLEAGCFVRYDTHNYSQLNLSDASFDPEEILCYNAGKNETSESLRGFDSKIDHLLISVSEKAATSKVGYYTKSENGIYGLAQCLRVLDMSQCSQCLNTLYTNLSACTAGSSKGRVQSDYCALRYQSDKFYGDGVPLLSPATGSAPSIPPSSRSGSGPPVPASSTATKVKKGLNLSLVLGLVIAPVMIMVMLIGCVLIWKKKRTKRLYPGDHKSSNEYSTAISKSKLNYKFQTLQIATKNFNLENKIGQGGFGSVYKGVLLNGREIVVKRLLSKREQSVNDFFNEVNLISQIQHKNLVNLLGFSVDSGDKLLVYEYLPNKSLDHFLFDENMAKLLNWQRRFEIILGTASGLSYLHQESHIRIIHRDIKASNILLDQHFKPKIADFGLVRHFSEDQTHMSTAVVVGTRGYMAPEYVMHGHLTEKVDVYAFGVLVLEIISGKKNITTIHANDMPLLTVIWNQYLSGTISNIFDPNIEEIFQDEVLHVIQVALLCTQFSPTLRPSMSKVIMFLSSKNSNLPTATQPPLIDQTQSNSNIDIVPIISLNTISTSSFGPR